MIVSAGSVESFSFAIPIGVGLVNSAINLTQILSQNDDIDKIIFIGSCGLYKDGKLLEIYETKEARNLEISALLAYSYSPLGFQNVSRETSVCNSSNFITANKDMANKFYETGLFMENMELYSVLEVAKNFQIPAYGILCATNFCHENAHDEFIAHHKQAKLNLENHLRKRKII